MQAGEGLHFTLQTGVGSVSFESQLNTESCHCSAADEAPVAASYHLLDLLTPINVSRPNDESEKKMIQPWIIGAKLSFLVWQGLFLSSSSFFYSLK